jgi:hypothetical protein
MHRLLIPLLACLFTCAPALLRAQVPHEIQYLPFDPNKVQHSSTNAEMPCGNAGTVTFGQFIGSSNDVAPAPIFLCFGDSLLVQHNGDADLNGDPNPATPPGIAYGFYTCAPTAQGPTLQDVIGSAFPPPNPDPCLLNNPPSATGMYQTQAVANGGATWFFNSGALQTTFAFGQPISIFFAPITVDILATNGYETIPLSAPGPCVAVSTAAAFEVVYLNEITATGISNNFGNDCLGRFTVRGGYPQYDGNAVYTINIFLESDPSVKAIVHTSASNLFHLSSVPFSVPVAGQYRVIIEDGKSCPASFLIDMNVCNPTDNLTLTFPDTIVAPGGTVCIPVTVQNFSILSGSFSIEWNESVLQYNGLQNVNSVIDTVFGPANLNEQQVANGLLGLQIFNNLNPTTINIPNDSVLFEICFTAIGQLGDCSGLGVTNNPTGVALEDEMGQNLALTVDTGQVCIAFLPLEFTFAVIDTNCLGQANLVITPSGGVEPYQIIVNENPGPMPGPNYLGTVLTSGGSFTVMNVGNTNNTPDTYVICVQDNNGNGATQCTTIVVNIPRLGAQLNFAQSPLCNGDSTGIINAVVLQGGVIVPSPGTNYTYAWSPANLTVQGSQVQNNVPAGVYTVTVTDTNTGCSEVASGSLGQPAPISSQMVTTVPAACSGVCDGTITYEAEGGVPLAGNTYQYAWTNITTNTPAGSGTGNPIVLSGICEGDYEITITDANGCTQVDNVTLGSLRELSVTTNSVQNVICNGADDGAIAITVTETMMTNNTYTFVWSPAGFTQVDLSPSSTYSDLPAGSYSVVATDNLGCSVTYDTIILEPALLVLDTFGMIVNPGCVQVNSGTISVIPSGGAGNPTLFGYTWSNMGTGSTQNMLPPGPYSVTVTDQNGCQDSLQFVLPLPAPPSFTATIVHEKCGGDGSLTVNAPTAVVTVWSDINGVLIDSAATIGSLFGGDYIVRILDGGGCLAVDTLTVNSVVPMTFSDTTLLSPTCFGFNNGQIAIGIQDGQPPYVQYEWDPMQPSPEGPVIFNLIGGTYTVTVTDNVGCTLVGTFLLTEPPAIVNTFDLTVDGSVSCFGIVPCDGEATPLTQYTTGPGDFDYLWSDGGTDSMRVDLCAGFNFVTITDMNNCFVVDTIEITTPPQITADPITTTQTLCFGDSTGTACVTAVGGNGGPYTFEWNTMATTNCINGVPAGNFTLTITDVNGCTNSINNIVIGQPAEMDLMTTSTDPTCFGGMNGQTAVDVMGGVPNYNYDWEDATGDNVGDEANAEMLAAGTYTVFVTDANGCTASANATIVDPPAVMGDYEPLAALTCNGDETTLNILSITGGSGGPYKFSVDFGAVLDPNFPVTIGGGQHFITYIDGKDCAITDSLFVAEPSPITVTFDPDVIEIELGATADLEPIITGAAVIGSFSWTNPESLLNPDTLNATSFTFTNITYTLTVMDTFGCSGSGSVLVNVDPNRNVYIPNAFIPANADGLNSHFNVNTGLGVELVNFMRVYDRWGELMYERERFLPNNDNFSDGWDGRYNGDFVNPGVFVYLVEVKFLDGRVLLYRGDVTVIR